MEKRRIAKNESIIEENEQIIKEPIEQKKEIVNKLDVPFGYIEIKLDSNGKLDAPQVLHFRNFLMEEMIELSAVISNEDNFLSTLIKCFNKMVYEDFDCALLHEKELEEIELSIFANFWGSKLEEKPYYIDDTIEDYELKNDPKNIGYAILPIKNLKTKLINKEFKEPVKIEIDGKVIRFKLPRIKDILDARNYIDKIYFEKDREISDIKNNASKKNFKISFEDQKKLDNYEQVRSLEFLKAFQSCIISSNGDRQLNTIEEKLEVYKTMDTDFWKEYQKITETIEFGVDPEVTFFSIDAKKELTRRFSFRLLDFLPTLELQRDSRASVSFGE